MINLTLSNIETLFNHLKRKTLATQLDNETVNKIEQYNTEERFQYFIREVVKQDEIWILADEHGCMMLNSDDEDCVPVWPNEAFAQLWATGDWQECKPQAISLEVWRNRWTDGLEEDELSLVVFPNRQEEGVILFPTELADELQKKAQKKSFKK